MSSDVDEESEYSSDAVFRAVWTCNSPQENHVMAEDEANSLEEVARDWTIHFHVNCDRCVDYNDHYEGSLDRVEVIEDGSVVDEISPETMIKEYNMSKY